jgi:hypothetical protein
MAGCSLSQGLPPGQIPPEPTTTWNLPAFPGAEGFGAHTPGGRGGRVILVTHLNDSGPGSLRAACEATGARIVIFRVAGMIRLQRELIVSNPFMTLAGQTAPGDGICLRDFQFTVATHDVVIRHLRSRLGDVSGQQADSIDLGRGARNVVIDHCSATWSIDEALTLTGDVRDVTVQWCLIGEALNRSTHTKGAHGYGTLARANGGVSLHHNLWIHNLSRNPRLGDNYGQPPYPTFDVRNNVIYNYGKTATGLTQGRLKVNYIGNRIRPGPDSRAAHPISVGLPSDLEFCIRQNIVDGNEALTMNNSDFFSMREQDGAVVVRIRTTPFPAPPVQHSTPGQALEVVLASVGASRPVRDPVDARLVDDVRNLTGTLIDSQEEVGGWPDYHSAPTPRDTDQDGMPDDWETARGLDATSPEDSSLDRDGDGYTNIEEYINSLAH